MKSQARCAVYIRSFSLHPGKVLDTWLTLAKIEKIRELVCPDLFVVLRLLEEKVGREFLVLVTGEVGLDCLIPWKSQPTELCCIRREVL